jgi:hypothetical protein
VKHHRLGSTVGVLEFVYTSFELRDGLLEHLGACSILAVRIFAIVGAIGAAAWTTHWANAIAFLRQHQNNVKKMATGHSGKK